jgi:hypothetical protein
MSLDEVREKCAWVAREAEHVSVDYGKIPAYVEELLGRYKITTELDNNHLVTEDREETAAYVLALDALNFGSGTFRMARDEGIDIGYTVFARTLKKSFEDGALNTPEKWTQARAEDMSRLFNIAAGTHAGLDRLFGQFAEHLRAAGARVCADHGGKVSAFVDSAGGSAEKLAEAVAQWPTFHDVSTYKGIPVPILKRAQILAADMQLARVAEFSDMDRLTVFADNRVPHVLRCDGILSYTPELAQKIDSLVPLAPGSAEEAELRAVTVHAGEFMRAAARAQGHDVTSVNLDHMLWGRGNEARIKERPTHRTLTVFY